MLDATSSAQKQLMRPVSAGALGFPAQATSVRAAQDLTACQGRLASVSSKLRGGTGNHAIDWKRTQARGVAGSLVR